MSKGFLLAIVILIYALTASPTQAQTVCRVADPTPTPLNVRSSPNGRIVGTVENGMLVSVLDSTTDRRGHGWVYVGNAADRMPIGWVFRDYINCRADRGTATYAETFHYSCKSGDSRYALTVNTDRGIVTLVEHGPPHTLTTFRILKVATFDVCGKYGWILNGATFCTATQGVGTLDWHGLEFDCDQADTE
jgi:hypothetical protein